ncbi:MAG: C39 family peptidase [Muricoprocola sp.]
MNNRKIPAWILVTCLGAMSVLGQTVCAEQPEEVYEEFVVQEEWNEEYQETPSHDREPHHREEYYDFEEEYQDEYYDEYYEEYQEEFSEENTEPYFDRDADSPGELHQIDDFEILGVEEAKTVFDLLEYDKLPTTFSLEVQEIEQNPELPTGCESVALTMALNYEGFELEKTTIAREYLIVNRTTDNMAIGYVGDPFSESGAGCFPPALAATANNFLQDYDAELTAYDLTGTEFEELFSYIAAGTPVVIWTTMYMAEPEFTGEVGRFGEREYPWYRQEHCVVMSGYNLEEMTVQINDPLEGTVTRSLEDFKAIYEKTGENAIVIGELLEEENIE